LRIPAGPPFVIDMRIRYAKLSDMDIVYNLSKDDFKKENWFDKETLKWIIKFNPKSCWVLEDKGKIIGARFTCDAWGRTAWGWLIIIKTDLRRRRLGTFLFNKCSTVLKKRGIERIMTDVYSKDKPSIQWHKAMGYRELGRVKDWFNKGKDAIIFCKYL